MGGGATPPADLRLDAPSLEAIGRDLDLMGKQWVRQAEAERVREWKAGMDKAWAENTNLVYRWLKQDYNPPLVMLSRPDGSLTGDLREMDSLLQGAWFPIMCKYVDQSEPSNRHKLGHKRAKENRIVKDKGNILLHLKHSHHQKHFTEKYI